MENVKTDTLLTSISFYDPKLYDALTKKKFKTIEEIISLTKDEVEIKLNLYIRDIVITMGLIDKLALFLHSHGFTFKGEYDHLNIGEAATLPISKTKLPARSKRKLQNYLGISILGELLDYDKDALLADKLIGLNHFEAIEESIEEMGYKFTTKNITKDTLIKDLSLSISEIKAILIKNGYKTVGDILESTKEEIVEVFKNATSNNNHHSVLIDNLSYYLHIKGFTYKNEFEKLDVKDKDALLLPIDNLKISSRTKNSLKYVFSIYFLGELLKFSTDRLLDSTGIGKVTIDELQKCVKDMGYDLKGSDEITNDTLLKDVYFINKELKKTLLEMGCVKVADISLLYRDEIYEELNARYGKGLSQVYMDELRKFFQTNGISLKGESGILEEDMLIKYIDYLSTETKNILISSGYKTIKDIISVSKEEIEKAFHLTRTRVLRDGQKYEETYFDKYCMNTLTEFLHISGYTYKGEFDDLGISYETLMTPIKDLEISTKLRNILTGRANGMAVFGDILNTSMEDIIKNRNFGQKALIELKDYVHSLGYMLKDEKLTFEEIMEAKKASGVELLEEIIIDSRIYMSLYRNGIFTIEDLKNAGPSVFEIKTLRGQKLIKLKEIMKKLNIYFEEPEEEQLENDVLQVVSEEDIEIVSNDNEKIKERIRTKESLLEEYNQLLEERKRLLAQEEELDRLIEEKLQSLKEGSKNVYK